jgi:hypothetical protein
MHSFGSLIVCFILQVASTVGLDEKQKTYVRTSTHPRDRARMFDIFQNVFPQNKSTNGATMMMLGALFCLSHHSRYSLLATTVALYDYK